MTGYDKICEEACAVAKKAGEFIATERKVFDPAKIEFKGEHDLVSYVDKQAERMIVDGLRKIVPGAGFITEEGMATSDGTERLRWVVDPLDGTTNFIHGLPPYCVCIALMEEDRVVVGVVYEVTLREMYYAWEGSAAYRNGEKISVSTVDSMKNALIAIGFSYSSLTGGAGYLEKIAEYQRTTDGIRRIGSAAADLVYVACGRLDAFAQAGLSPWDVAAGAFITTRAGARVSDYRGGGDYIFGGEVLATTPAIYEDLIKTV